MADGAPIFSAVSGSARQLFNLLRCIGFSQRARVHIHKDGLRFSAEHSRVAQGHAFLDQALFTTFLFSPPPVESPSNTDDDDDTENFCQFSIDLRSLLETLQMFGLADAHNRNTPSTFSARGATNAFDNRLLGMASVCRLSYQSSGSPLKIVLEEAGVTTTCELTTYELDHAEGEDIPFARDELVIKIIMRSSFLHDAVTELSSTNPETLVLRASPSAPFLSLSAGGTLGSTVVEFASPAESDGPQQHNANLLETFQVAHAIWHSYRFALIKMATHAMAAATKVSIRCDSQGVLSFQFMIKVDNGAVSFVDFRIVPLADEQDDGLDGETTDDDDQ